jgi:hypothetical protein
MRPLLLMMRIMLIVLILSCGVAAVGAANLTLQKDVVSQSSQHPIATVVWKVNLTNLDPTPIDVNVTETLPSGCIAVANTTSRGTYSGSVWNVTMDANSYENLTLTTECTIPSTAVGTQSWKNYVEVTSPDEDVNSSSTAYVAIVNEVNITVRPETMNARTLNLTGNGSIGNGVATVFITADGLLNRSDVSKESVDINCNHATPEKVHSNEKDGGTLMLKFRRAAFLFDGPVGDTVWINCSGTVTRQDGTVVRIDGGDQVRVIASDKSLFDQFLEFVGLKKDKEREQESENRKVAEMQGKYDEHFDALNRSIQCGLLPATINLSDLKLDVSAYTSQTVFTPSQLRALLQEIIADAEFEENSETAKDMIEDAKDIADKISNRYGRGKGYWGNHAACPPVTAVEVDEEENADSECTVNADCGAGYACTHHECEEIDEDESECTIDNDCDDGEKCIRGECKEAKEFECDSDNDCGQGEVCKRHECEEDERFTSIGNNDCDADKVCDRGECERRD